MQTLVDQLKGFLGFSTGSDTNYDTNYTYLIIQYLTFGKCSNPNPALATANRATKPVLN